MFHLTGSASDSVYALAASSGRLYAGGDFATIGGLARPRAASLDLATGAADPAFDAQVKNGTTRALALGDGQLYLTGDGLSLTQGSTSRSELAAVDPASGNIVAAFNPPTPFNFNSPKPLQCC